MWSCFTLSLKLTIWIKYHRLEVQLSGMFRIHAVWKFYFSEAKIYTNRNKFKIMALVNDFEWCARRLHTCGCALQTLEVFGCTNKTSFIVLNDKDGKMALLTLIWIMCYKCIPGINLKNVFICTIYMQECYCKERRKFEGYWSNVK